VPTIGVATWPAEARLFAGEDTAGPVPTLFTEDIDAASEAIMGNARRAHQDMQRLMRMFLMPELVSLEEALPLIKKPRWVRIVIYSS
jgi:hypothetical protein